MHETGETQQGGAVGNAWLNWAAVGVVLPGMLYVLGAVYEGAYLFRVGSPSPHPSPNLAETMYASREVLYVAAGPLSAILVMRAWLTDNPPAMSALKLAVWVGLLTAAAGGARYVAMAYSEGAATFPIFMGVILAGSGIAHWNLVGDGRSPLHRTIDQTIVVAGLLMVLLGFGWHNLLAIFSLPIWGRVAVLIGASVLTTVGASLLFASDWWGKRASGQIETSHSEQWKPAFTSAYSYLAVTLILVTPALHGVAAAEEALSGCDDLIVVNSGSFSGAADGIGDLWLLQDDGNSVLARHLPGSSNDTVYRFVLAPGDVVTFSKHDGNASCYV